MVGREKPKKNSIYKVNSRKLSQLYFEKEVMQKSNKTKEGKMSSSVAPSVMMTDQFGGIDALKKKRSSTRSNTKTISMTLKAPIVTNLDVSSSPMTFSLKNVNFSVANALRRTILADIPISVIKTCHIRVNSSRMTNEILEHRLFCIPVFLRPEEVSQYKLRIQAKNLTTDQTMMVTSRQFQLVRSAAVSGTEDVVDGGVVVDEETTRRAFPPTGIDGRDYFIDFVRLRPRIGPEVGGIPGEEIDIEATFAMATASENACYNVVSKCSYGNTVDPFAADAEWERRKTALTDAGATIEDVENAQKDFNALDTQRFFVPDSFDFQVMTLADNIGKRHGGHYENTELLRIACQILIRRFQDVSKHIETGDTEILQTMRRQSREFTDPRSYDIVLVHEGYTIGKVLEYFLHLLFFKITDDGGPSGGEDDTPFLIFCGFCKPHPHDPECIIRVVLGRETTSSTSMIIDDAAAAADDDNGDNDARIRIVQTMVTTAAEHAANLFSDLSRFFTPRK
jgi:hypothetical protein